MAEHSYNHIPERVLDNVVWRVAYTIGYRAPRANLPAVIGFVETRHGKYMIDTRTRIDGMPLFHGYDWELWQATSPVKHV